MPKSTTFSLLYTKLRCCQWEMCYLCCDLSSHAWGLTSSLLWVMTTLDPLLGVTGQCNGFRNDLLYFHQPSWMPFDPDFVCRNCWFNVYAYTLNQQFLQTKSGSNKIISCNFGYWLTTTAFIVVLMAMILRTILSNAMELTTTTIKTTLRRWQ